MESAPFRTVEIRILSHLAPPQSSQQAESRCSHARYFYLIAVPKKFQVVTVPAVLAISMNLVFRCWQQHPLCPGEFRPPARQRLA